MTKLLSDVSSVLSTLFDLCCINLDLIKSKKVYVVKFGEYNRVCQVPSMMKMYPSCENSLELLSWNLLKTLTGVNGFLVHGMGVHFLTLVQLLYCNPMGSEQIIFRSP
jgi:hypothetical protein